MRRLFAALLLASSAAPAGDLVAQHDTGRSFCGTYLWAGIQAARTTDMNLYLNGGFSGGASYSTSIAPETCALAYLEGAWVISSPGLAPLTAGLGIRIGHPAQLTLQAGYTGVRYTDIGYQSGFTGGLNVNFLLPSLSGAGIRVAFNYTLVGESKPNFWAVQSGVSYQF